MNILPIHTDVLQSGDNLVEILLGKNVIEAGDIVVLSSKAMATVEGAAINLSTLTISDEARALAKESQTEKELSHLQAIIEETERMNGRIIIANHGILLTELHPDGMQEGRILITNAGLDLSNVEDGYAVGWPVDPAHSLTTLKTEIETAVEGKIGLILSDSGLAPRRKGVTAFALCACGIDPIISQKGKEDLFGRELKVTEEAVADQLSTAANAIMGNSNQCCPAAVVRGFDVPFSDFCGWVPGIDVQEDIFHGLI